MKNYFGKTVVCLDSNDTVHIYEGYLIRDARPYENSTYVYDDEGERIACIECNGQWASIVESINPIAQDLSKALEFAENYHCDDAAMSYAYKYGLLYGAIKSAIYQLKSKNYENN